MSNSEQKSYRLIDPWDAFTMDQAILLTLCEPEDCPNHENRTFHIEHCGEYGETYRVWEVIFFSRRCPSCGRFEGTTDPGVSDSRKEGGTEHICWKCADVFRKFIIKDMLAAIAGNRET